MPRALAPLHHLMAGQHMQVIDQLYQMLQQESRAHAETLQVLQTIKKKEKDIDQLIVSDDGWRWMPEPIVEVPKVPYGTKAEAKADAKSS